MNRALVLRISPRRCAFVTSFVERERTWSRNEPAVLPTGVPVSRPGAMLIAAILGPRSFAAAGARGASEGAGCGASAGGGGASVASAEGEGLPGPGSAWIGRAVSPACGGPKGAAAAFQQPARAS